MTGRPGIIRVFVYGTLKRGGIYHSLIEPLLERVYPGRMQGLLYDLPYGFPAMTKGRGWVYGEVLELRQPLKALEILDELEDYRGSGKQNMYVRHHRMVITSQGRLLVYVYWWADPGRLCNIGKLVTSGCWEPPSM